MRSKDPHTQVGACIVNERNIIVGIGYNGFPRGCSDDEFPWKRRCELLCTESLALCKDPYVCHAELNAILNTNKLSLGGCRIYVALFPCNECAKCIIQKGIKEVIYYSDKYKDRWQFQAAKHMFDSSGISYRQHIPSQRQVIIDFTVMDTM